MQEFLIYLLGWLIFSIGYFIYAIKEDEQNKKLAIYHALIYGIVSWLGILFINQRSKGIKALSQGAWCGLMFAKLQKNSLVPV